jgi:hypothetical protein
MELVVNDYDGDFNSAVGVVRSRDRRRRASSMQQTFSA